MAVHYIPDMRLGAGPDDLALIPKSRRRKILPTYKAAVPAGIAALPVEMPTQIAQRIAEVDGIRRIAKR